MALRKPHKLMEEEEEADNDTPIRYLPLDHLYSSTSRCINPSGSTMSKKIKARKLPDPSSPLIVYHRRDKKQRLYLSNSPSNDSMTDDSELGFRSENSKICRELGPSGRARKKKSTVNQELASLGIDSSVMLDFEGSRLRESRVREEREVSAKHGGRSSKRGGRSGAMGSRGPTKSLVGESSSATKKWVELSFDNVDPAAFIGLKCKVFWPMDDAWYRGSVSGYSPDTNHHHIHYDDEDDECLLLSAEKMKFFISREEMQHLNLKFRDRRTDARGLDYDEMFVLAAGYDDHELDHGDVIWAKLTGYAVWPAFVMDEVHASACKGLDPPSKGSVPVQFFGTYDYARISMKHVISFVKGLLSNYHMKCNQARFLRALEEAKRFLEEQKLPDMMAQMQTGILVDNHDDLNAEEMSNSDEGSPTEGTSTQCLNPCPFEIGDLRVLSLGKIVKGSEHFHNERHIWPEGYTAVRKFLSTKDPTRSTEYRLEVLKNPRSKEFPLFRITLDDGEQIAGSTPAACWKKIYKRIKMTKTNLTNGFHAEKGKVFKSGSLMFGFTNKRISKLIQELPNSRFCSKFSGGKLASGNHWDLPTGYRAVRVDWKDLDRCNVCHMDEEYENNLFLQCDKCRMMVHARCYGELDLLDGKLWLCNLCRPGAPKSPPPCCLCPVVGGAMKPTTDGRWAHLTCATWIPETCLLDIKKMEPIDGVNRISKDRWKLLCGICGVAYGACIQCSNSTCRVAYHPLCARAAGLCVELDEEDTRLHLMTLDEDDDQCVRLLSFCKKHRQPSDERPPVDKPTGNDMQLCSNYTPPSNPSGCARSEPFDLIRRRGRKEPEALAAASVKRLYVENRPYLISGYRQNGSIGYVPSHNEQLPGSCSQSFQQLKKPQLGSPKSFISMSDKYEYMRATFRRRLAFGKSAIHGFGIFTKLAHRAGDMVIEYTGELVRPTIADIREHLIYNSLVGAGTYMFRIDDERVVDATRAGSIAHLINHSCEPNCYSRVITVNGDEHIIIFAKRDISQWEELTYDYRFLAIDEQLACYCGFPRCRGIVNDIEAEEQMAKLCVPRRELVDWKGE
ncbi:histone-lysine N-methyltransferase TRX1 [Amborella trichopoda]|uniref:Histone-lysine N-methyltransferase n=1 Tax=Amborella trichopoda TaxID=13333 RepID=W1PZZ8_AMBTC|nr:histone-lysine N-methyltransferase TRX1 [Amborella trichopoda]XP_020527613.1 histone-lysine N-methyltransferase TRX1 [Amborella trichopoda]ERN13661.1 hypothetical protein AMTR_s00049p00115800 [Amborella trichopoda]|eukprot:XP_006852194.1 histone-lysine N-methyltransferase TRX1 [Amborella trichopoda]